VSDVRDLEAVGGAPQGALPAGLPWSDRFFSRLR
jgi:hypothetical protein